jgi:AcrR family transcriptional regulator
MATPSDAQPTGLRERKKAHTRAAIQDHALRLYLQQGYEATTIRQIAAAAEVSESTFLRYFPTKADTVMYDRWDPVVLDVLARQPTEMSPTSAIRAALHEVMDAYGAERSALERMRWRLIATVPELRAAVATRTDEGARLLAEVIAERLGTTADDFAVRTWVGALIGVLFAAMAAAFADDGEVIEYFDAALDRLETGVPLPAFP